MSASVMNIQVLLFAQLRDAFGCSQLILELPADSTVADAIDLLAARHAPIAALQNARALAFAVNEQYASSATPLTAGCTLALIPPVSGG